MRLLPVVLVSFVASFTAAAQNKVPPRPALGAGADTNDAAGYYSLGMALVSRDAAKAADAFYWSTQLNPGQPEALYARRVALLMAQPQLLPGYWTGERRVVRDKAVVRADSLYLRALTINPFFYRKLDGVFFDAILRQFAVDAAGASNNASEIQYEIEKYLATAPADLKAWRAYSDGRFDEALVQYAKAIKSARKKASLRYDRGSLFYQLDKPDSALAELTLAAEELRKADKKDLVFLYQSKGLLEHALGMVQLRSGKTAEARESFGRALQEDLSYSPAHVQLGFIALEAKDTATAVSEFDLATQIAADDAALRYQYGYTLQEFGKSAEAEVQLKKAIELNAFYAAPYLALAKAQRSQNRKAEALEAVKTFLALSARSDPRRAEATQLMASLTGTD
jgi:Tfp pilus assembly protein PilF